MRIEINTDTDSPKEYRAISAALLMLAGDIPEFDAETPIKASDVVKITEGPLSSVTTLHTPEEVRQFFGDVPAVRVSSSIPNFPVPPPPPPPDTVLYATPPLPPAVPGKDADGNENGTWIPSEAHGGYVHTPAPLPSMKDNVFHFPPAPPVPVNAPTGVGPMNATATIGALIAPLPPLANLQAEAMANLPANALPTPPAANVVAPSAAIGATGVTGHHPAAPGANAPGASEVDRSGLPWDERIHQKGKSQKRDGTWKLKKGVDPTLAAQVVQELSARRVAPHAGGLIVTTPTGGAIQPGMSITGADMHNPAFGNFPPPPPPSVPLPPAQPFAHHGSMPVPQPPPIPSGVALSPPQPTFTVQIPTSGTVPQPPAPAVNATPGVAPTGGYKRLMDKLMAATTENRIDPRIVNPTVQKLGAPNLHALGTPEFEHLLPQVEAAFAQMLGG